MESLDKISRREQCELNIEDLSDIMSDLLQGDNLRLEFNQILEEMRGQISSKTAEINELRSNMTQLENEMTEIRSILKNFVNKGKNKTSSKSKNKNVIPSDKKVVEASEHITEDKLTLESSVSSNIPQPTDKKINIEDKLLPPIVDVSPEEIITNITGMLTPPGFIAGTNELSKFISKEESIPTIDSVSQNPNITLSDTNTYHNPNGYVPLFPSFNGETNNESKGMLYSNDSYWNLHCEVSINKGGSGIINFLNGIDNRLSASNIINFSSSHRGVTSNSEDISMGIIRYTPDSELQLPYLLTVDIQLM